MDTTNTQQEQKPNNTSKKLLSSSNYCGTKPMQSHNDIFSLYTTVLANSAQTPLLCRAELGAHRQDSHQLTTTSSSPVQDLAVS